MIYFFSIFTYLLILTGIGIYKIRKVKNQDDFAIAGRSLSPWIMVCTMLSVWIGTGSILGNAEQTYDRGMAALLLPTGTFIGLFLLSLIATRARNLTASSVPEIIGMRFGQVARTLAVISLITAYMVIVSYQFNAGGAVLEVITGSKDPVAVDSSSEFTARQIGKGRLVFKTEKNWTGQTSIFLTTDENPPKTIEFKIDVVPKDKIIAAKKALLKINNSIAIKENGSGKIIPCEESMTAGKYVISTHPEHGSVELIEPKLTAETATLIAAIFIIAYTIMAGLMSLAYTDIVTGIIITLALIITFPIYWFEAGGWDSMVTAFTVMGKPDHMKLWTVYSPTELINFCLPVFLLILGDANQYQRIFASKNAKGAKSAVTAMIFVAYAIELLIIACAWTASSMTADAEEGKYILIYAAKKFLPLPLSCLFMVTAVGIIISTADSFLLVPATTFIKDVYLNFINPKASDKRILFLSRLMVLTFGIIAYLVTRSFAETTGFFRKALYAFTIYGSSITPSIVAAIIWNRATKAGSITSILSGMIVTLTWKGLICKIGFMPVWITKLDAVLPAISISIICLVLVSLLTQPEGSKTSS